MREILFRGKNADNGEWVYGSYFAHQKIRLCIVRDESEVEENTQHLIVQDALACDWGFKNGMQVVDVLPETVGEYTGLTDKNGKKIFEGDILQDKFGQIKIVDYSDEWGAFRTCFVRALNDEGKIVATVGGASFVGTIWRKYEVIGNIHDNPELLEVKNERV